MLSRYKKQLLDVTRVLTTIGILACFNAAFAEQNHNLRPTYLGFEVQRIYRELEGPTLTVKFLRQLTDKVGFADPELYLSKAERTNLQAGHQAAMASLWLFAAAAYVQNRQYELANNIINRGYMLLRQGADDPIDRIDFVSLKARLLQFTTKLN